MTRLGLGPAASAPLDAAEQISEAAAGADEPDEIDETIDEIDEYVQKLDGMVRIAALPLSSALRRTLGGWGWTGLALRWVAALGGLCRGWAGLG